MLQPTKGLALSHKVQETPVLRDVAMLGYGTMIARYCSDALECPVELLKVKTILNQGWLTSVLAITRKLQAGEFFFYQS